MKKLIYTLPFIILLGCTPDFEDIKPPSSDYIVDIFQIESTTVRDGDKVVINFESASTYTLSLTEEFTNVTYTNEKFNSVIGANTLTIRHEWLHSSKFANSSIYFLFFYLGFYLR